MAASLDQLDAPDRSAAERIRETLVLFEEGVETKRRSLRRRFPQASEEDVHAKLLNCLQYQDES